MESISNTDRCLQQAADAMRKAEALLIGAGAGMGVDSGLPDFRGPEGFWKAYPPFRGQHFSDMSTPHWFRTDPSLAWGFFGHRLNLYRAAVPHPGFDILRRWGEQLPLGSFVFTSNVDGHFQKAGFAPDRVLECHGSVHYLQCNGKCGRAIWSAEEVQVDVDEETIRSTSEVPTCQDCGSIVRPNILMFYDWDWDPNRYREQRQHYESWLRRVQGKRVVAMELGAGLAIPTVRNMCERVGEVLIRINPREADTPSHGIPVPMGALDALTRMDRLLEGN